MVPDMTMTRWLVMREMYGEAEAQNRIEQYWLKEWGLVDSPTPEGPDGENPLVGLRRLAASAAGSVANRFRVNRPAPSPQS